MNYQNVLISVTEHDITNGMERDCSQCPVALAAKRVFGNNLIAVSTLTINLYRTNHVHEATLAQIAIDFINRLDNFAKHKHRLDPFEFFVVVPFDTVLLPILNNRV